MSISIEIPKKPQPHSKSFFIFRRSVSSKEMIFFLGQLSMMLEVGISLSKAIESIASQIGNSYFGEIMKSMVKDIEEGRQLSDSMRRHPKVFKPVYTNMIKSGETGGFLNKVIDSVIEIQEKSRGIAAQFRTALAYPAVLCALAILVTIFVLLGILPKFMVFFEGKYQILPITTRFMMWLSIFLRSYWWILTLIIPGFIIGVKFYLSSKKGQSHLDWITINIPFFSKISNNIYTGIFLRTMGNMLESGVSLKEALSIAGNTLENYYYRQFIETIQNNIEEGISFSKGFAKNKYIHESVKQMISVGEEVGKLPSVMLKLADFYESEIEHDLKRMTSMIEPLALIFMGGVVWVIVSSIVLPMFKLAGAMS